MATSHQKTLTPEQSLARQLRIRESLVVPVDVDRLLRKYADVEFDNIPGNAEAVLLYPSPSRARPLVVISLASHGVRLRFTMAHELGHIVIPWHLGELAYRPSVSPTSLEHSTIEAEANRFASEILMPSDWVTSRLKSNSDYSATTLEISQFANVSVLAASLAVMNVAPPRVMMLVCNQNDQSVATSIRSPGTTTPLPDIGAVVSEEQFTRMGATVETKDVKQSRFMWIAFGAPPSIKREHVGDSRTLLNQIVGEISCYEPQKIRNGISAITGNLSGQHKNADRSQLLGVMHERFSHEVRYASAVAHPMFLEYLRARAAELRP